MINAIPTPIRMKAGEIFFGGANLYGKRPLDGFLAMVRLACGDRRGVFPVSTPRTSPRDLMIRDPYALHTIDTDSTLWGKPENLEPVLGPTIGGPRTNARWREARAGLTRSFQPAHMQAHQLERMHRRARQFVDDAERGTDNLVGLTAGYTSDVIFDALLGVAPDKWLADAFQVFNDGAIYVINGRSNQRIDTNRDSLTAYCQDHFVKERDAQREGCEPNPTMLGLMLAAHLASGEHLLDDDDFIRNMVGMLFAGFETTSNALAFATGLLHDHPDVYDNMSEELRRVGSDSVLEVIFQPSKLWQLIPWTMACIYEALRVLPPVWGGRREAVKDHVLEFENGQFQVFEGDLARLDRFFLQRDPRIWGEEWATSYRPDLWPEEGKLPGTQAMAYAPFAAGKRICMGQAFAIAEMVLVYLEAALRNLRPQIKTNKRALYAAMTMTYKHETDFRLVQA